MPRQGATGREGAGAGLRAEGSRGGTALADAGRAGAPKAAKAGRAARSIEDIKLVFERQKGAIYALYNRALRDDPALQGKVALELKIAPSGAVEALRIVSSELRSDELERKLLARLAYIFRLRTPRMRVSTPCRSWGRPGCQRLRFSAES